MHAAVALPLFCHMQTTKHSSSSSNLQMKSCSDYYSFQIATWSPFVFTDFRSGLSLTPWIIALMFLLFHCVCVTPVIITGCICYTLFRASLPAGCFVHVLCKSAFPGLAVELAEQQMTVMFQFSVLRLEVKKRKNCQSAACSLWWLLLWARFRRMQS